jgi:GYF domain 2
MDDTWYLFDETGKLGPLGLRSLRMTLATYQNARDIPVWRDGFPEWKRAEDIPELAATVLAPSTLRHPRRPPKIKPTLPDIPLVRSPPTAPEGN